MSDLKRIGIFLIILAVFFSLIFYPFTKPTRNALIMQMLFAQNRVRYEPRLSELEIVLREGQGRIAIPYRHILVGGITITFAGLALIILSGIKKR